METPAVYKSRLTAEQFATLEDEVHPLELVRGWVVREPVPTRQHGAVCAAIASALFNYAKHTGAGRVYLNDTGFILERDPDTVRGPDVSFVRQERCDASALTASWLDGPPDLVVEVLSPSERQGRIEKKLADYLRAGVHVVWVIDPRSETVSVFERGTKLMLSATDELTCPQLLTDFAVPIAELFA